MTQRVSLLLYLDRALLSLHRIGMFRKNWSPLEMVEVGCQRAWRYDDNLGLNHSWTKVDKGKTWAVASTHCTE